MQNLFGFSNFSGLIWIIPVAFFIHELEEWNILRWYKRNYKNIPESTDLSIRLWILFISTVMFLITGLAFVLPGTPAFGILTVFISAFISVNTVQHIIWTFQYKSYSPGLVTALFCFAATCFVNASFVSEGVIAPCYYGIFILTPPTIIKTLRSKHEMTPEIRKIHMIGIFFERCLRRIFSSAGGAR